MENTNTKFKIASLGGVTQSKSFAKLSSVLERYPYSTSETLGRKELISLPREVKLQALNHLKYVLINSQVYYAQLSEDDWNRLKYMTWPVSLLTLYLQGGFVEQQ